MLATDHDPWGRMLGPARGSARYAARHAGAAADARGTVPALLAAWRAGDDGAVDRLVPLVHDALDALAARHLAPGSGAALPPTPLALVDDAWRALVRPRDSRAYPDQSHDRARFAAVASRVVRRVVAAHARRAAAEVRRATRAPGPREEWALATMAVEDALAELALVDPRLPRIVECRLFGGLTDAETAEALGVSGRTVHRDWRRARAWLELRLGA